MKWEPPNSGDPRLEYKPFSNLLPKTEPRDATAVRVTEPVMKAPAGTPMGNEMGPYGTIEQGEGISMIDKLNRQPITELAQQAMDNPVLFPMMGTAIGSVGKEMLKRAIGRVATNIKVPVSYEVNLAGTPKEMLRAVIDDVPTYSKKWIDGTPLKTVFQSEPTWNGVAQELREFPYRKGFGLSARRGGERYYLENPDGTYRFSDEALQMIDRLSESRKNMALKDFNDLDVVLGSYKSKMKPLNTREGMDEAILNRLQGLNDIKESYYDKWDFKFNKGDANVLLSGILKGEVPLYDPFLGIPVGNTKTKIDWAARGKLLKELVSRTMVNTVFDPITIRGIRKHDITNLPSRNAYIETMIPSATPPF